jgi:polyferredoxin
MKYPRGLIRYATENGQIQGLTQGQMFRRVLRPRVLIYGSVLIAIATAFVFSLTIRHTFKVDVVRDRMMVARVVEEGQIENLYRLQLMNATEQAQRYHVSVAGIPGVSLANTADVEVPAADARWIAVAVRVPQKAAKEAGSGAHPIRFEVNAVSNPSAQVSERSTFVVPR